MDNVKERKHWLAAENPIVDVNTDPIAKPESTKSLAESFECCNCLANTPNKWFDLPLCRTCSFAKKTKRPCSVCGAESRGIRYGALACDKCRDFFRRSGNGSRYECRNHTQKRCVVRYYVEKKCAYCRYQRCLAVGMKKR